MSEQTNIEWATSTGNPWIGCTKISPGCARCYAETLDRQRFSRTLGGGTKEKPVSHWGKGAPRFRTKGFWKDALKWNRDAEICKCGQVKASALHDCEFGRFDVNYHTKMNRPRIFPSLCDWLDEEVPIEWLADFLKLIHDTPNLDWLLLTKRPENWAQRLTQASHSACQVTRSFASAWRWGAGIFPANIWVGVSVEDQQRADERISELLKIPAKVRFLSVEPLLGPVDLHHVFFPTGAVESVLDCSVNPQFQHIIGKLNGIDWVIVGGESGPKARGCDTQWVRYIIEQCKGASVPVFCKQLGRDPLWSERDISEKWYERFSDPRGGKMEEWPIDLRVRQFPK